MVKEIEEDGIRERLWEAGRMEKTKKDVETREYNVLLCIIAVSGADKVDFKKKRSENVKAFIFSNCVFF